MKKITLKSLELRNFKGAQSLKIDFDANETFIFGDNATCKTTIFDAFTWVLWGKNSENESDFDVKTLDKNNNPIHKLEHEVTAIILIDGDDDLGDEVVLKRVLKEKWTKKHGSEFEELTGNTTFFYVNDVPLQANEYKKLINQIIPDAYSRLLTDPLHFNTHIDWKERRKILTDLSGDLTNDEVISEMNDSKSIIAVFEEQKSLDQKKAEISPKIKKLKEELKTIPARIDEVDRSKPEALDFESLKSEKQMIECEIDFKQDEINSIQKQIESQGEKDRERLNKIQSLKNKIEKIKIDSTQLQNSKRTELLMKQNGIKQRISELREENANKQRENDNLHKNIQSLKSENEKLKTDFFTIKNEQLEPGEMPSKCHSCGTAYTEQYKAEKRNEIISRFNESQAQKLSKIQDQAQLNNEKIQKFTETIQLNINASDGTNSLIQSLETSLSEISVPELVSIETNEEIEALKSEIERLSNIESQSFDSAAQKQAIQVLKDKIADIDQKLLLEQQIERSNARIKELTGQQKTISNEIAQFEKIEFAIDEFNKIKMRKVEEKVNSKFVLAQFKMFDLQMNGAEAPTCVCTHNGVPFDGLNNAMKPNVGLDIIRTLQDFYQIKAPIFIDNRESISEILDINTQIVNLVVEKGTNQLVIK